MFMSGGTNGTNSHDSLYIVILLILLMIAQVITIVIILTMMKEINNDIRCNCPHLNYLQEMYANILSVSIQ